VIEKSKDCEKVTCSNCADANDLEFDFSMAFQPIINCKTRLIYGYEALVIPICLYTGSI